MTARPRGAVFPVVIKDVTFQPPDASAYYVLAANGLFLVRHTPLFSASVRVDGGVPGLDSHEDTLSLQVPRLPRSHLERAMGFFRAVYERWRGEAILIVFYAPSLGRFELVAPPQLMSGRFESGRFRAHLGLDYRSCEKPGPEYVKLGTIHSHAHLGPKHSGVDILDEMDEAGLHITAGYVNSRLPEFAAAFVVGGARFTVPVENVLPPFIAPRRPPASWIESVVVRCDPMSLQGASSSAGRWDHPESIPGRASCNDYDGDGQGGWCDDARPRY